MQARSFSVAGVLALAGILAAAPAHAQLSPSGASFTIASMGVRGSAVAFDSKNNVYLAVGAYGTVVATFVKPDGTVGNTYTVFSGAGEFAHYPAVAFSPDADGGKGAFLVTWHAGANSNTVRARLVSYTSGVIGSELTLGGEPTWWESAPNVAYSSVSRNFLVVWRIQAYQIRAARVSSAGALINSFAVTTGGGERDPSVAYNPSTDQYLVAFSAFSPSVYIGARLVNAATGAMSNGAVLGSANAAYITDATFSSATGKYFVGWYQLPGGPMGRLVDANGNPDGSIIALSNRFGTYDSFSVDYNRVSGSYLMVGQDTRSAENGGVELSETGTPGSGGALTFLGGKVGNFYPQVGASTASKQWLLTTANDFSTLAGQFAVTTTGPSGPPAAATLVSPVGDISNRTPTFVWNAATGASQYYLWVTDATGAAVVKAWYTAAAAGCSGGSGTCSISPGVALAAGSGSWWIKTWNESGEGPWSSGASFNVVTPPGATTLLTPNGATTNQPTYKWNAVGNATYYYLWVTDSSGTPKIQKWYLAADAGCGSGSGVCAITPAIALNFGTAAWWVQTYNNQGYGPWSSGQYFRVSLSTPSPTGVTLGQGEGRYKWTPVAGATYYYVWVTDSSGTPKIQQWFPASQLGCTANECAVTISRTMNTGPAWFWVQAWSESAGYSEWSNYLAFVNQ